MTLPYTNPNPDTNKNVGRILKILIINDPGIPGTAYHIRRIERLSHQLANHYTTLGHSVTLMAGPGSTIQGKTITFGRNILRKSFWQQIQEILYVWIFLYINKGKFDCILNFGRLIYLLPVLTHEIKKIQIYQREVTIRNIQFITSIPNKKLYFAGCSNYISQKKGLVGYWHTIYNFVDVNQYAFVPEVAPSAPLVFLGRIERVKGCHHCIALAKKLNHPLVIAGNISHLPHEKAYFEKELLPHIDGKNIKYIGAVNDAQKNELLGNALALLMLIDWDEPFGIVMVEAMACGTPVVGFARGAVPEVVTHGLTGLIVDLNSLYNIDFLNEIKKLSRVACRKVAETKFSVDVIARQYIMAIP